MNSHFRTTRWTLVLRAAGQKSPERNAAMAELLSQNWYPLYAFLRRSGKQSAEIEDLVQGFYAHVLENDLLGKVEYHRQGRFRNFLLVCLKNYQANQWQREQAIKRGGGKSHVSITHIPVDLSAADRRYQREPDHELTPERAFERAWAIEMIDRSMQSVANRWRENGKAEKFESLKGFLIQTESLSRDEVAEKLKLSPGALKLAIHRLRAEFRQTLCQQVVETLERDDLLEDEINLLFSALST